MPTTKPKPCKTCLEWQKVTGQKTPEEMKVWLTVLQMDVAELRRNFDEMKRALSGDNAEPPKDEAEENFVGHRG